MKLGEMADLISGLATALGNYLTKSAQKDLLAISDCFRAFSNDSTTSFCTFVKEAKEGKVASSTSKQKPQDDGGKVQLLTEKIQHFLNNKQQYDYPALRQLAEDIGKLTNPEIKKVGKNIGCPLTGKKDEMKSTLNDWLSNIKLSSEQSSFT